MAAFPLYVVVDFTKKHDNLTQSLHNYYKIIFERGRAMKDLVEVIAKSLVDCPDEVVVTQKETDRAIIIELRVAQSDMGKVIGKQGRIAKAIRAVVKAAASKEEKKVVVDIM